MDSSKLLFGDHHYDQSVLAVDSRGHLQLLSHAQPPSSGLTAQMTLQAAPDWASQGTSNTLREHSSSSTASSCNCIAGLAVHVRGALGMLTGDLNNIMN